eukprot:51997-Hanusia_phi.AAC.1
MERLKETFPLRWRRLPGARRRKEREEEKRRRQSWSQLNCGRRRTKQRRTKQSRLCLLSDGIQKLSSCSWPGDVGERVEG